MADADAGEPAFDDEPDGWDQDPPSTLLAFGVALAGGAAIAVAGYHGLPLAGLDQNLGVAAGVLAAAALGIALLVGFTLLRRHALTAKLGVFLALAAVGAVTAILTHGAQREIRLKEDLRTIAELKVLPDGKLEVPPGTEARGPVSRAAVTYFRAILAAAGEQDRAIEAYGIHRLGDPQAVSRDPALLTNCDRFEGAKALSDTKNRKLRAAYTGFRAAIEAADIPAAIKADTLSTGPQTEARLARLTTLEKETFDAVAESWRFLARRHWRVENGQYAFTSLADLIDYNRNGTRIQTAVSEIQMLQAQGLAQMREGQAMIRRGLR